LVKFNAKYIMSYGNNNISGQFIKFEKPDYTEDNKQNKILFLSTLQMNRIPFVSDYKLLIIKNGSILSHALIISRELKIPVILGTNSFDMLKPNTSISIDLNEKHFVVKEDS